VNRAALFVVNDRRCNPPDYSENFDNAERTAQAER
jgi:hypothetical protein